MFRLFVLIVSTTGVIGERKCQIGNDCSDCTIAKEGDKCTEEIVQPSFYCDTKTNKIDTYENAFLSCNIQDNKLERKLCNHGEIFIDGICRSGNVRYKRQVDDCSGRVGDTCSLDTDCLTDMFCSDGSCKCFSNFVAIKGYCYSKKNIGESGCQYSEQCSAVWPGSRCERSRCVCPHDLNGIPYVQARTRDGIVCILKSGLDDDPVPKCPLPEYDEDLLAMPVSQLRNPAMTDPDDADIKLGEHVNPLQFCSSSSTDYKTFVANGGGACVYSRDGSEGDGVYIADLYDCVTSDELLDNVKFAMEGIYNISLASDGICCPSKAFTCIQPKREANISSASAYVRPRWWYNAITGDCEQFMWDPWDETEIPSPNNFKTREHCQSYCGDTCKRGSPQYVSNTSQTEEKSISNWQSSTSCTTNYECTSVGSMQMCCPTIASICSHAGARPDDPLRSTNFDPGVSMTKSYGLSFPASTRYYYDVERDRCIPFKYNGAFGNYNNFKSAEECELFCGNPQCDYGTPLGNGTTNQRCYSNAECPITHECQMDYNVCCPRPPEPECPHGDVYKDNEGNHFSCSNSSAENTCPTNYECYFDGRVWGCCPMEVCTENQVSVNGQCMNRVSIGEYCIDQLQCPANTVCKDDFCECLDSQIYVDGICQAICDENEVDVGGICLPMVEIDEPCETDQQCRGRSKCINTTCACRAGEDNVYGVCVKRMASRKTTTCPITGQTPLIDELTMRAKFCEPSKNICPHGYSCQFSETARRNICCGIGEDTSTTSSPLPETTENSISTLDPNIDTDAQTGKEITRLITTAPIHGVCEKGSPYLMNGRPKQCTDTPCPPNYKCRFSKARRNYYCCTTSNYNHGCPSGYPLLFPSTGTPVQCSYRRSRMCPAGYTCVRSITTKIFQCCSTNDSSTGRSTPINREISNKKNNTQAPCLNGQVLVLRIVDEHIVKKCEASCPPHQIAVQGVCRDRYQDDKPIMLNLMT